MYKKDLYNALVVKATVSLSLLLVLRSSRVKKKKEKTQLADNVQ